LLVSSASISLTLRSNGRKPIANAAFVSQGASSEPGEALGTPSTCRSGDCCGRGCDCCARVGEPSVSGVLSPVAVCGVAMPMLLMPANGRPGTGVCRLNSDADEELAAFDPAEEAEESSIRDMSTLGTRACE